MAITKLLRIKETQHGQNPSAGLRRCIQYICNPSKSGNGRWIGGNCGGLPDLAYTFMVENKKHWDKESGSQGFHYVISFSPDENVSPQLALLIADEFCVNVLPGHLYVTAVHLDTNHMHVHIAFDSVNANTGRMYHSGQYDWLARIQPVTDELCRRYGLKTLDYDPAAERLHMHHGDWDSIRQADHIKKDVVWNDIIRSDIEQALQQSTDWNTFLQIMRNMHYTVHDGKYLSLHPYGKGRAVRSARLGTDYSKAALQRRISNNTYPTTYSTAQSYRKYGNVLIILRSMRTYLGSEWQNGFSPMQKEYYRRWMALSHINKPDFKNSWRYKSQVTKLGQITDDLCYLFDNNLSDVLSVQKRLEELQTQHGPDATRERKICSRIITEYKDATSFHAISNERHVYVPPAFSKERIFKVTVNQTLFQHVDFTLDHMTVRIPGAHEYLEIHTADSRSYNNSRMLSSYLYADADYRVLDQDGKLLRMISGDQVAAYFDAKEISKEKENRHGRKEDYR